MSADRNTSNGAPFWACVKKLLDEPKVKATRCPVSFSNLGLLFTALSNPWVIAGILLLLGFFASYLTALSWADLTFVLPSTAFGYIVVALLAHFWQHEHISLSRWLGIILIVCGVGFVANGPSLTEHPAPRDPEPAGSAR